jgi:hypothetical protein
MCKKIHQGRNMPISEPCSHPNDSDHERASNSQVCPVSVHPAALTFYCLLKEEVHAALTREEFSVPPLLFSNEAALFLLLATFRELQTIERTPQLRDALRDPCSDFLLGDSHRSTPVSQQSRAEEVRWQSYTTLLRPPSVSHAC